MILRKSEDEAVTVNKSLGLFEHKCKQCGKMFEATSQYVFKKQAKGHKNKKDWFCSYKCFREVK